MIHADKPKTDRRDIVLIRSAVLTVYFPWCIIWVFKLNSAKYIIVVLVVVEVILKIITTYSIQRITQTGVDIKQHFVTMHYTTYTVFWRSLASSLTVMADSSWKLIFEAPHQKKKKKIRFVMAVCITLDWLCHTPNLWLVVLTYLIKIIFINIFV